MALSVQQRHESAPHPADVSKKTEIPGGHLEILSKTWRSGARYQVENVTQRGGLGVACVVRDRELDRLVAMRVIGIGSEGLPPIPMEELPPGWVERFLEEARILAQLEHPGILPIHDLGLDSEGRLYFTTPLVQGRRLSEKVCPAREQSGGWNHNRVIRAFLQACEAVAYAHQQGVLHRNLKPDNILVGDLGQVYVIDWGVACAHGRPDLHDLRPRTASASMPYDIPTPGTAFTTVAVPNDAPIVTRDGTVLGIPAYMPPEQAHGQMTSLSARSDVYSLGAILYELIQGHGPYLDATPSPSARQVLDGIRAGPPSDLQLPAWKRGAGLVAICNKAMQREPMARYAHAGELVEELRGWIDDQTAADCRPHAFTRLKGWILRLRSFLPGRSVPG
ncbi:MAG: serine/threonine protein kinase [Verrucomicrobiales bacterium]|nr:serine/threonine protein kinase [Verrucomicrobiales bacterium]